MRIDGTLDLNGQEPTTPINLAQRRLFISVPGSGGYAGGAAGITGVAPAQAGQGPLGGAAGSITVQGCMLARGFSGGFSGNSFLLPLVGGSGGGGGVASTWGYAQPGGAGGGAIAIISSTSITVNGAIKADGGGFAGDIYSGGGGAGSGGAIRLVATTLSGNGTLSVQGYAYASNGCGANSGPGWVRLESFQQQGTFNVFPTTQFSLGTPFNTFLPTSSVRVVRVNGAALPPNPSASFTLPDVTISQTQAVTLDIEAKNIPLGTIINLEVFSENPTDNTIVDQVVASTPLAGQTATLSTANASFTFPPGFSRCWVRATWTQ